jgi:hypothetical protein
MSGLWCSLDLTKGSQLLVEIITAKIVVKIATKVLSPIANEHKSLDIAHKVATSLDNIGLDDVKELVAIRRKRKALRK